MDWDDKLPIDLSHQRQTFRNELHCIETIPRWISFIGGSSTLQLHGFADASLLAYSALVYSRIENPDGVVIIQLVAAITKVAPLKQLTVPRLELWCSFFAKYYSKICKSLDEPSITIRNWTDSMTVLAWLNGNPNRWKTYMANRVTEILNYTNIDDWAFVNGESNPADCASR